MYPHSYRLINILKGGIKMSDKTFNCIFEIIMGLFLFGVLGIYCYYSISIALR